MLKELDLSDLPLQVPVKAFVDTETEAGFVYYEESGITFPVYGPNLPNLLGVLMTPID